jgi:hypothetical protein
VFGDGRLCDVRIEELVFRNEECNAETDGPTADVDDVGVDGGGGTTSWFWMLLSRNGDDADSIIVVGRSVEEAQERIKGITVAEEGNVPLAKWMVSWVAVGR